MKTITILFMVLILAACADMGSRRQYDPYMCVNCVIIADDAVRLIDKDEVKTIQFPPNTQTVTIKEIKFEKEGTIRIEVKADVKKPLDIDQGLDVTGGKLF
jgi:hypothetical protein